MKDKNRINIQAFIETELPKAQPKKVAESVPTKSSKQPIKDFSKAKEAVLQQLEKENSPHLANFKKLAATHDAHLKDTTKKLPSKQTVFGEVPSRLFMRALHPDKWSTSSKEIQEYVSELTKFYNGLK